MRGLLWTVEQVMGRERTGIEWMGGQWNAGLAIVRRRACAATPGGGGVKSKRPKIGYPHPHVLTAQKGSILKEEKIIGSQKNIVADGSGCR